MKRYILFLIAIFLVSMSFGQLRISQVKGDLNSDPNLKVQLKGKASIAGAETLTNKTLTSPKINENVVLTPTSTELNYVDGVTSAIQTQFAGTVKTADLQDPATIVPLLVDSNNVASPNGYATPKALQLAIAGVSGGSGTADSIRVLSSPPTTGNAYISTNHGKLWIKSNNYWKSPVWAADSVLPIQAEYQAVYDAMTVKPSDADKAIQNKLVYDLKDAGVWDNAIVIDNLATHDSQSSLINWKSPGTFNPVLYNAPTHTAYKGFQASPNPPGLKSVNSNFTPSTNGAGFLGQNDITVIAAVNAESINGNFDFGSYGVGNNKRLAANSRFTNELGYVACNSTATSAIGSLLSKKYIGVARTSATSYYAYRNLWNGLITGNSTTPCDKELYISASDASSNDRMVSFFIVAKYLTPAQYQATVLACERYLTNYGNQIRANYQKTIDFNVVLEGHSFFIGRANDDNPSLINTKTSYNSAVNGSTMSGVNSRASVVDSKLITETATYKNILNLWIGINSVSDAVGSGATEYALVKTYVQARAAAGWKVLVYTMTPTDYTRGAQFEIERTTFNDSLRTNLASTANVYILNTDAVSEFSYPVNPTYFDENKLHVNGAGGTLAGNLFSAKIAELYP